MTDRPPRILIDARMLIGRFSGVSRVVTRLVETLAADRRFQVIALCGNELHAPWVHRGDIEQLTTTFTRADRSPHRRRRWEARHLRRFIRAAAPDVYHAVWNGGIPPFCPVPAILTLHDLIPWSPSPPLLDQWSYRRAVRAAARRAACVTTVSEYVRGEVLNKLRIAERKVVTVPNGVDAPIGTVTGQHPEERPYTLYVGGHEPRKNVAGVLSAMRMYWTRYGYKVELRLTGTLERLDRAAARVVNEMPAEAPIVFLGDPHDDELRRQYQGATALLLLSEAEGFGLPALEAMANGCPVIAANRASLPEVVGDAGVLVEPGDLDTIVHTLDLLETDHALRDDFVRRGLTRAAHHSWSKTAAHFADLYLRLHAERSWRAKRGKEPNHAPFSFRQAVS